MAGFLEAFLVGASVGAVGVLAAVVLLARNTKGRSVARFVLPGRTANEVYQIVSGYAASQRMRVTPTADGLLAQSGSEWIAGARILEVHARDGAGGCEVLVEGYLRGFYPKEVHLDPSQFFGALPRRQTLRVAQGLLSVLGAGAVAFEHCRAG